MTGLYIHIPFCKSRCIYCGFYSTTRLDRQNRYVEAVCREMELRKSEVDAVGSVYLGGGTPSVLTEEQLCRIFESIERNYIYNNVYSLPSLHGRAGGGFGGGSEITLECNPDDVTDEFCATLRQLPVNRISMGAQTFDDARLKFLRRRHNSRQIAEAVSRLRHAGIENISIDLMFGFPGETLEDWEKDIECALRLNVEHISAYALMKSPFRLRWMRLPSMARKPFLRAFWAFSSRYFRCFSLSDGRWMPSRVRRAEVMRSL